jgi:hypothetical protein
MEARAALVAMTAPVLLPLRATAPARALMNGIIEGMFTANSAASGRPRALVTRESGIIVSRES